MHNLILLLLYLLVEVQLWCGAVYVWVLLHLKKKTSFLHDLIIVPSYARRFPPKIIITRIERGVFLSLVFGLWSGRSDRAGL
jgi:hypothetical protein